jgi:hypothetical protein
VAILDQGVNLAGQQIDAGQQGNRAVSELCGKMGDDGVK